jgi:hypothetical protein
MTATTPNQLPKAAGVLKLGEAVSRHFDPRLA